VTLVYQHELPNVPGKSIKAEVFPINLMGRPQAVISNEFSCHLGLARVVRGAESNVMDGAGPRRPARKPFASRMSTMPHTAQQAQRMPDAAGEYGIRAVDAIKPGAPVLWDEAPDNLCIDVEAGDRRDRRCRPRLELVGR